MGEWTQVPCGLQSCLENSTFFSNCGSDPLLFPSYTVITHNWVKERLEKELCTLDPR